MSGRENEIADPFSRKKRPRMAPKDKTPDARLASGDVGAPTPHEVPAQDTLQRGVSRQEVRTHENNH